MKKEGKWTRFKFLIINTPKLPVGNKAGLHKGDQGAAVMKGEEAAGGRAEKDRGEVHDRPSGCD